MRARRPTKALSSEPEARLETPAPVLGATGEVVVAAAGVVVVGLTGAVVVGGATELVVGVGVGVEDVDVDVGVGVGVDEVEVEVGVGVADEVDGAAELDCGVLAPPPTALPLASRYQFPAGSPRHSPKVTSSKPAALAFSIMNSAKPCTVFSWMSWASTILEPPPFTMPEVKVFWAKL